MKLREAQRISQRLEEAEREFDSSWSTRWRSILFTGGALSLPLCVLAAQLAAPTMPEPGAAFVFMGTWAASLSGLGVLGKVLRRRVKRREGMESMDARVLRHCASVGELPSQVTEPLERALSAYQHLSRMSGDPLWSGSGLDIRQAVDAAGRHLIALLDWGKRLGDVGRTVAQIQGRPGGAEARARYQEQLAALGSAASAFEAAEARAAQAYVALSGAAPGQSAAPEELASMTATFEALAEVVGGEGAPIPRPTAEEPATLRAGRVS